MDLDLQPMLEDELVLLRPLKQQDMEPLFRVANDLNIWQQHPCYDRYKRDVYESFFQDALRSRGALLVLEKSNKKVIGSTRFNQLENSNSAIEIGWSFLSREYWGGSYNRAMKTLMIDHAFQAFEDIIFYIDRHNIRSRKALEKIGAKRLSGSKFRPLIKAGEKDFTYCLNKLEWQQKL